MKVKILGAGCANCNKLYEATKKAAGSLDSDVSVEKVEDYQEIMKYGVLQVPALVIDEQVVLTGKVPSVPELTTILATALQKSA